MDTDSVVQYLNVQLTLSGIKMAAYPDFSVVVRVLKRIINQITDDLLDTQLILGQFLWNIIWYGAFYVDSFKVSWHPIHANDLTESIAHIKARLLNLKLL